MAVVGSPRYFESRPRPHTPYDLTEHSCINLRLPTSGGQYSWEFERDGRALNVRVTGQFICDDVSLIVESAATGLGLCCLPEDHIADRVSSGQLIRVLEDWCPPFTGYHLYYPSRRQLSLPFRLLVNSLRS